MNPFLTQHFIEGFKRFLVAQVEMTHRLSSSLYDAGNKMSKGQEMYLKRMKKSGKWIHTNVDPGMSNPRFLSFTLNTEVEIGGSYYKSTSFGGGGGSGS